MTRVGVDVGGTFTDLVAVTPDGRLEIRKVASTPQDPSLGLFRSLDQLGTDAIDVQLEVWLSTEKMRREGAAPVRLSEGNLKDLYWTPAQMLTHHASNDCNLRAGDLMGSGTVSGATPDSLGCLLEMTRRGAEPLRLPNGEVRSFLEDGDEVILRGYCEREGFARIGFGECRGVVARGES